MKTAVFVDAFNLYYGALRDRPYRWLNIQKLCQLLLPQHTIAYLKYFTALVSARPNNAGQPIRQQAYLRALKTIPHCSIHYGHYLTHKVWMPKVLPAGSPHEMVRVFKTEEKGSDVNLATHFIHDAHMNKFDIGVIISNDSDLLTPIRLVRETLNKKIGILNPHPHPSQALLPHIDFIKPIRPGVLKVSQFPPILHDESGECHCPSDWIDHEKETA